MAVETYRKEEEELDLAAQAPEQQRYKQLAEDLGLKVPDDTRSHYADDAARVFGELTGEELATWQRFLPTSHSMEDGDWVDYEFDVPPLAVLEEISTAKSMGIFHDIEIWTPEGQKDPMAVGVIHMSPARLRDQARFFPIVRWGESLMPFEEIQAIVKKLRRGDMIGEAIALMIVLAIFGAVVFGVYCAAGGPI